MFKFLRKYNKWILAVGGGLLMIVFLLGDTVPRLFGGAGGAGVTSATVGINGSERVRAREWSQYVAESDFLRTFEQRFGQQPLPMLGEIRGAEHWFLLVREARSAGLISPTGSVPITEDQLWGFAAGFTTLETAQSAFTNLLGVERMLQMYLAAGEVSDHRLRNFAARMFHTVEADVAVIPAPADPYLEPDEDQIVEHFERFKDYSPGEGPMGLGYRLPNRVKLEWLTVDVDDVRSAIAQSDEMGGVALRRHWRANPRRTFPEVEPGQPVPDVVREDLLNQLTQERMEAITTFATGQLSAARRGLPQREGYFVLPDDWDQRRLSFTELSQAIQERFNVPLPPYQAIGDRWLRFDELPALPGIGTATTDRFGTRERRLRDLVSAAKEFDGSTTIDIQSRVAGPPLRDRQNNVYVFRILDTDPARPPHSVDEVRDELVYDLKRIAGFEDLLARASVIEQVALERGIVGTAVEFDAEVMPATITLADTLMLQVQLQMNQPLRAMPSDLPIIGAHRPTVEAIIDHSLSLPMELPVSQLSAADRTVVVPVEDHLSVVVARIRDRRPLSRETYSQLAASGLPQRLLISEELDGHDRLRETFGLEALKERHNLQIHRRQTNEFDDDILDE